MGLESGKGSLPLRDTHEYRAIAITSMKMMTVSAARSWAAGSAGSVCCSLCCSPGYSSCSSFDESHHITHPLATVGTCYSIPFAGESPPLHCPSFLRSFPFILFLTFFVCFHSPQFALITLLHLSCAAAMLNSAVPIPLELEFNWSLSCPG